MTSNEILALRPRILQFLRRFDDCFVSEKTREHLRVYVQGQLSNLPRKSVEPIATAAEMAPKTLQQFLSLAKWDHVLMRDRLQQMVAARHRGPQVIGVFDETGCPKKGQKTPGVQRQYCGATGKIDNCIVTVHLALADANDPGRNFVGNRRPQIEEGATVRERQKIFSLPNLTKIQVNAKVRESQVDKLLPRMKARVKVDAFPEQVLTATVRDIAPLPDPSSFFSSDIKVYTTHVTIDELLPGLRPGMTAQVEILVYQADNVLSVPVKAVLAFDGKYHVAVKRPVGGFDWREVDTGLGDEKVVEIKHGLKSGEIVILEPLALMSEEEKRQKLGSPPRRTGPAARKNAPR